MRQMVLNYNDVRELTEYKKNKTELVNILKLKTKKENDKELNTYLNQVLALDNKRLNYPEIIEMNGLIKNTNKEMIQKVSNIFSRRLQLEIDNIDEKSIEVSINILNSTIGSINEHFRKIVESTERSYEYYNSDGHSMGFKTKNLSILFDDEKLGDKYEYKY